VDGWVLPDTPMALMAKDADNDVPVITGYQANDGLLFSRPVQTPEQFAEMAKRQYGEMADEFLHVYQAKTADEAKEMLAQSIQDRDRVSMYLWASRRESNHHAPVFTYYFDRAIPWPQHPEFGAFHSGELPYFFLNLRVMDRPWEKQDYDLAQTAATYLKDFAATGNPNGDHLPQWAPVSTAKPSTMEIGLRSGEMPLANAERLAFWEKFFSSPMGMKAPPF
jgi:para-nitrobenzyl esterase